MKFYLHLKLAVEVSECTSIGGNSIFFSGFEVATADECLQKARIVVTATGCKDIIHGEMFEQMLEDCIVCNIGHYEHELDIQWLYSNSVKRD